MEENTGNEEFTPDLGPDYEPSEPAPSEPEEPKGPSVEELQARLSRMEAEQNSWKEQKGQYESMLADERKRVQALAGVEGKPDPAQEAKNKRIREALLNVFPELKNLAENPNNADADFGKKAFLKSSAEKAFQKAEEIGFKSEVQKGVWATLGDLLIWQTPAWKQRFYEEGDSRVVDEVGKFIVDNVIEPFRKDIEAQVIDRIKKSGLPRESTQTSPGNNISPLPQKQTPAKKNIDLSNDDMRNRVMTQVAAKYFRGNE